MSLISTKNFIAPLTNRVHIVSIILCTIAFAMLRLSGCSFQAVDTSSNESFRSRSLPSNYSYEAGEKRSAPVTETKKSEKDIKKDRASGGSLEDIEKTLGIE